MNKKCVAAAIILFCYTAFPAQKPGLDSLEKLVRAYELAVRPDMNPAYQLTLSEHDVQGLWDSLRIHFFKSEYRSSDGIWFRDEEFIYRNGHVRVFLNCFGGHGMMSGVMKKNCYYYTYSFGSGIHRSHLGRLFFIGDSMVVHESGGYMNMDFIVAKSVHDTLYLYRSIFKGFNDYECSPPPWGMVQENESSVTVTDTLGHEIAPDFPGTSIIETGSNGRVWGGKISKRQLPVRGTSLPVRQCNLKGQTVSILRYHGLVVNAHCKLVTVTINARSR